MTVEHLKGYHGSTDASIGLIVVPVRRQVRVQVAADFRVATVGKNSRLFGSNVRP